MDFGGQGRPGTAQILLDVTGRQGESRGRSAAHQDPSAQQSSFCNLLIFFFDGQARGDKGTEGFQTQAVEPWSSHSPCSLLRSNAVSPGLADHYRAAPLRTALLRLGFLNHPQPNPSPHQVTPPQP